jgi:hypothetical protein
MKGFFEFKLGSMMIDEYERRFLEFMKYVTFIEDDKVKIQSSLSGFPTIISDKIQYDDPKILEETIMCTEFLYDKQRGRPIYQKDWEDKMKGMVE